MQEVMHKVGQLILLKGAQESAPNYSRIFHRDHYFKTSKMSVQKADAREDKGLENNTFIPVKTDKEIL